MSYVEIEDLRLYLDISTTTDNNLLEGSIEDAQSYIESQTNRRFEASTDTRYYLHSAIDPWDNTLLHVDDDLLTVTTLSNGDTAGTTIVPANYWLVPFNLGPPYHAIQLKKNTGVYWEFDTDYRVSVLGTWGFSSDAPYDIKRATLVLAAYFYRAKDSQMFDTTAIVESGAIAIPQGIPATVDRIIKRYKRYL